MNIPNQPPAQPPPPLPAAPAPMPADAYPRPGPLRQAAPFRADRYPSRSAPPPRVWPRDSSSRLLWFLVLVICALVAVLTYVLGRVRCA